MTKRLVFAVLLIGSVKTGWTQNEPATNSFNLEQCVEYALKHNQNVLNKALDKEIAETQVGETLSRGLPQVNVNGGINYNYSVQKSLLNPAVLGVDPENPPAGAELIDGDLVNSFQQDYDGNLILSARQLIFDGSFFVGLQAARTFRELSSKDHIKSKIDVTDAVTKAYYNLLITNERLELIEKNYSRLDTLMSDTEALYTNGFVEKIDVSRVRVQYNNLTVERNKLIQLAKISNDLLKFQMGMALTESLEIDDSIERLTFEQIDETLGDFKYAKRIEYSQLLTNQSLLQLDMKNNRVQRIPTLYVNFNYGYLTSTSDASRLFRGERWLSNGALGLTMSVPLFDGFLKKNKIQKNQIQLQQVENSMKLTENSIDLQIKQAKINLNIAVENMSAQKENMELAEEVFNVTKIKYEEGIGSNSEVLDADTSLKQAQTNYYSALFDALVSKVDLQKAYGTLYNE